VPYGLEDSRVRVRVKLRVIRWRNMYIMYGVWYCVWCVVCVWCVCGVCSYAYIIYLDWRVYV
jgi:hypothetical protein